MGRVGATHASPGNDNTPRALARPRKERFRKEKGGDEGPRPHTQRGMRRVEATHASPGNDNTPRALARPRKERFRKEKGGDEGPRPHTRRMRRVGATHASPGNDNAPGETPGASSKECRRRPTLPRSLERSTIGAVGLNDRVRNGNECGPYALVASDLYDEQHATMWKHVQK